MKNCLATCQKLNVECPIEECRYWISYPQDRNCSLETVDKHGALTLREVADRLGVSFVRIKQIEDKALKKIGLLLKDDAI
jgi:hypothetical protein